MIFLNTETQGYREKNDAGERVHKGFACVGTDKSEASVLLSSPASFFLCIPVSLCLKIIVLVIVCAAICSCKSSKDSAGTSGVVQVSSPEAFSSRAKFTWVQGNKGQSINGTVKMQRDERLQISLVAPVLRTEAVRIEATPEQILVIDRINKQYAVAPVSELHLLLGDEIDYNRLQTLLVQAVFLEGTSGWMMRQGGVDIVIPVGNTRGTDRLLLELNRIEVPHQALAPTRPSSRYEKKELSEVIEGIEQL